MSLGLYTSLRPEANVSATTLRMPRCGSDNDGLSSTTLPSSSPSSPKRRSSSGMSASSRPRNSAFASTQSCEIVPSRRASTGYCRNKRANLPSANRRTNCRYRDRPSGSCASANKRSQDDCSCARMVSNSVRRSSPERVTGSAAARAPGQPAPLPKAALGKQTYAWRASRGPRARTGEDLLEGRGSRRPGSPSRLATRRPPPPVARVEPGGAPPRGLRPLRQRSAVAEAHRAESGANRLQVQAVPGQPPLQPVPVPLPQGLAPRLEPFVHQGRVHSSAGTKSPLRRSSTVLARSTIPARSCFDIKSICFTTATFLSCQAWSRPGRVIVDTYYDRRFYTGHGAKLYPWRSAHVRLEGEPLHVFRVIAAPISGVSLPPLLLDRVRNVAGRRAFRKQLLAKTRALRLQSAHCRVVRDDAAWWLGRKKGKGS